MKVKFINILGGVTAAALALGMTSCELDFANPNQFDASNYWQNEAQFQENVIALGNAIRSTMDQTVLFTAGELRTDYYWPNGSLDGSGLNALYVTNNQFDADHTQFSNYANLYQIIDKCNIFIYYDQQKGEDVLTPESRNYMLGMIYGVRAYANFLIHKMYGTGPLRNEAEVVKGNYNDLELVLPQAGVEEFLQNIKNDVKTSLDYFTKAGDYKNSIFSSYGGQVYWSKAATEMLAGEVYLWSGKVTTLGSNGEGHKANPADIATAKTYFENVLNNYGYKLMPDYYDAINVNGASNTERIFGSYYSITEATTNWFNYIMYDNVVGGSIDAYWTCLEDDGITPATYAARLTRKYLPGEENVSTFGDKNTFFLQRMSGQNRYQVRNAYYFQVDEKDTRRQIFMPLYRTTQEEIDQNIRNIAEFDFSTHPVAGLYVVKYRGELNTGTQQYVGSNYMTHYRLAAVYAYLAEIANYENDKTNVEFYMNELRKRAFGGLLPADDPRNQWDPDVQGYKAGSYAENEIAILQERAREFFQEGTRWWDLRRMTLDQTMADASQHLIFRPEGCMGYGLDLAAHPDWFEVTTNDMALGTNVIATDEPLLDYDTQAYLVLWPLDKSLMDDDKELKQTPGYRGGENGNW